MIEISRDNPPIALPALGFSEAQNGALRYGGYPRLPMNLEWPVFEDGIPFHFVAEIDLTTLPREMEQAGHHFKMPEFPKTGFIYIFMRLEHDRIYEAAPVVLYAPDARCDTPFRAPPKPLAVLDLDHAYGFLPESVAADGVSLNTGYMKASAFLSSRAENPLWRNMDRDSVSEDEIYRRDKAFADQLNALGIQYDVHLPSAPAAREPLFDQIPHSFKEFLRRGVFQWDWPYLFEVTKKAYALCHNFPVTDLLFEIAAGNDRPRYRKFIAKFESKRDAILSSKFEDLSGWWEKFACDHIPALTMRVDVQLCRWMGYARVMRHQRMTEADKEAFVALLKLVDSLSFDDGLADLRVLARFRHHNIHSFMIESAVSEGFQYAETELRHLHPEAAPKPDHDFGDADASARQVQVFGAGYLLDQAAIEHEDKVMLFQISSACGVEFSDGIIQIWIKKDDLAFARFEKAIATIELT